ncbi:MAG: nucleotidyltransferase family protein [Neptuniibacter sp.]
MLRIMIMAAGESSRFEGCKLLAHVDGVPMLHRTAMVARELVDSPAQICAVTGAWHEEIQLAQDKGEIVDVSLLYNPDWEQGLGNSIAFAVQQLKAKTDQLLILLADQVAINPEELKDLLKAAEGSDIACAFYSGKSGVPAVFGRKVFPLLEQLNGDRGAKELLNSEDLKVTALPMDSAAIDIDRENELKSYHRLLKA